MIQIRRKKESSKSEDNAGAPSKSKEGKSDSAFVGAYPGKPWERLTNMRHGKGSRIKTLSEDEQKKVIQIAKEWFGSEETEYPRARLQIQEHLDHPNSELSAKFFNQAEFLIKRLTVRAYLSNADGRFIKHEDAKNLLEVIAIVGLDFEVGAIDHIIDKEVKTELVVGDATEVISDNGYWFAHTHPAKRDIFCNFLPSTQDIDVMVSTAISKGQNIEEISSDYYVYRDIGSTKIHIDIEMTPPPTKVSIQTITIEYSTSTEHESIKSHLGKLRSHLRMRHNLKDEQILVTKKLDPGSSPG